MVGSFYFSLFLPIDCKIAKKKGPFDANYWSSSLTAAQSQDLDRAQRMAMAAIAGRWEPSYSRHLLELGLAPVVKRNRVELCRIFAGWTAKKC